MKIVFSVFIEPFSKAYTNVPALIEDKYNKSFAEKSQRLFPEDNISAQGLNIQLLQGSAVFYKQDR